MTDDIGEFVADLQQRVHDRANSDEVMVRDAFVLVASEYLTDDGLLENPESCFFRRAWRNRNLEVAGYDLSSDGAVLSLLVAHYGDAAMGVRRSQVDQLVRYALNFVEACQAGLHDELERSSPVSDMADRIRDALPDLQKVRVVVLTDGAISSRGGAAPAGPLMVGDLPVTVDPWDITRLHRLVTSGRGQEEIVIDVAEMGYVVAALESQKQVDGYRCVLAVLPGKFVAELYDQHHSRLLQRNVRAFLQARGKVNKGIAETIRAEPGRFLAYNNGISATATEMETGADQTDRPVLRRIRNLQIVNGGQTTASLHAALRAGVDLSDVYVAAKFTVVGDDLLDELVPSISRFANSQNAVTAADFEGNSPFHVQLERHSRSIWAPAVDGAPRQTHWYYERVRGQYDVDRARFPSRAKLREFDQDNPKSQKITKTDAAKCDLSYGLRPDIVSLGGQKCFQWWSVNGSPTLPDPPTETFFRELVAKVILFARVRKVIQAQGYTGYLANLTAYTIALVVDRFGGRLDLDRVWRTQEIPVALEDSVPAVAARVRTVLVTPPGSGNVTEWCKKEACWERVRRIDWTPPTDLVAALSAGTPDAD